MARPWQTLDVVPTAEGELKLLARGERDFMITVAGRVLMVSQASRSEQELARLAGRHLETKPTTSRGLIGGLGMGYTLRAALDSWPSRAQIVVCEITEAVVTWCRGPLAGLTDHAVDDPRVVIEVADVATAIQRAAKGPASDKFDAIVLDLYEGPNEAHKGAGSRDHYSAAALTSTRQALREGGIFAVWSEEADAAFEKRLRAAGFNCERHRPRGSGGRRHVIYLAQR